MGSAAPAPPVNQPPVARISATPTSGAAPLAVVFDGAGSSDPDGDDLDTYLRFDQVGNDMTIAREEIFGPVAPLFRFADEAEAVAMANDTEFGLAGYVCGRNVGRALAVAERIEAGVMGVNRGFISDPAAPFGGFKQSGLGREVRVTDRTLGFLQVRLGVVEADQVALQRGRLERTQAATQAGHLADHLINDLCRAGNVIGEALCLAASKFIQSARSTA